jgi:hypothetical protein
MATTPSTTPKAQSFAFVSPKSQDSYGSISGLDDHVRPSKPLPDALNDDVTSRGAHMIVAPNRNSSATRSH